MKSDVELLHVVLPGLADFSIYGPIRELESGMSPALARTSLTCKTAEIGLHVLSEAVVGSRSASTLPYLFEQTAYHLHLSITSADGPPIRMMLRGIDLLAGRRRIGKQEAYAVPVNFQSEVGHTEVEVFRGQVRLFALRLEVFPSKIDYRTDLLELRADLQMEVRSLVFELYGRTFQTLRRGARTAPQDIEWLAALKGEFLRLTQALETIARSPLQKVCAVHEVGQSMQPQCPGAEVRAYLRQNAARCFHASPGHFTARGTTWRTPRLPAAKKSLSPDTPENRYVAGAINKMRSRIRRLLGQLAGVQKRDRFASWTGFLEDADRRLRHFQTQSFLANLGVQHAHVSPTLALHLTPGYREFFSSSMALEAVLQVGGGPLEMPEKDLSSLYELWCFVALAGILRRELNLTLRAPTWLKITRRRVALELVQGKHSVLSMEKEGRECLRVVYNRQDSTPTGDCRPDNTLEIFKEGEVQPFHYVFDAKYRLQSDADYRKIYHAPGPPPDAIHRMHAYRDQIVAQQTVGGTGQSAGSTVWDVGYRRYVQKTVGAFVLYPYAGADAMDNRFVKAIDQVGVGGLPFLPSRKTEVTKFLRQIIDRSSEAVEDLAVVPCTASERQRIEWSHEYGLIAIVPSQEQFHYIRSHGIYHSPYHLYKKWGLRLRASFILFILSESKFPGQSGVAYQSAIKSVHFGKRRDIFPAPPSSSRGSSNDDPYVWFQLQEVQTVTPVLKYEGSMPFFAFTTRLAFTEARTVSELLLIREPERRFYLECRNAGLKVSVREESRTTDQVFDIVGLSLLFTIITQKNHLKTDVRFDPVTARFKGAGVNFAWNDLMFDPHECLRPFFDS